MIKIKRLGIKGIRGIKDELSLDLGGRPLLLYGDNGSGKSSISDALEWFYYDRVKHLSSAEIDRKGGIEALRNVSLANEDEAFVDIEYTDDKLNSRKTIDAREGPIGSSSTNLSNEFTDFMHQSANERLILRYKDLVSFILDTPKPRLDTLSDIIGFSQVTDIRSILKTATNDLSKELKTGDFDNRIGRQQSHIIGYCGQIINTDTQFVNTINALITPLGLNINISKIDELETITEKLKKPEDEERVQLRFFYTDVSDKIAALPKKLQSIEESYSVFLDKYQNLLKDTDTLWKVMLEKLLNEAIEVLKKRITEENFCPICLQPKETEKLLLEIETRLAELQSAKAKMEDLDMARESLKQDVMIQQQVVNGILDNKYFESKDNSILKEKIGQISSHLNSYLVELDTNILEREQPKSSDTLKFDQSMINKIDKLCQAKITILQPSKDADKRTEVYGKLELIRQAYLEIKSLGKEKRILETQQQSLELVYGAFVNRQKEALDLLISRLSSDIDDFYQFMNPNEEIRHIQFATIEKDDELTGLTIQFEFCNKMTAPPHKYFSESHLNCLGVAFFLASVKAFNKVNRFVILDDVISSFDSTHRKRFADMLNERFSQYQLIVLTHEPTWFEYMRNMVKGRNWIVTTVKWSKEKGTHIDEPIENLRERIERRIAVQDTPGLGNDIRKYLEHILKEIAFRLEVKVSFRFNEVNEDRMAYELLTELKGNVKNHAVNGLKNDTTIDRLLSSLFIGSKESHDSSFNAAIHDLKGFWRDVEDLESLLFCKATSCKDRRVSLRHYDDVNKKIQCGCGNLSYGWKR